MTSFLIKRSAPLILLLGLFLLLGACRQSPPVLIGFVGGLSGRSADLGIGGRDGATLAVEEVNARGGVRGRQLKLLVADDRQKPQVAREAFSSLVAQGATAVVGPMTSSVATEVVSLANEARIPLISPTTSTNTLSGKDDYFFRVYPGSRTMAEALARYAFEQRKLRRFGVFYDLSNRSHTEGWLNYFTAEFEALGGEVIAREAFFSGRVESFFELSASLLGRELDGVLILANALDTAMICQQFRKQGSDQALFGSEWSATRDLLSLGGRSVEGLTLFHTFDRNSSRSNFIAFKRRFFERFGYEPGFAATHGYDAVQTLVAALKLNASGLKIALKSLGPVSGAQSQVQLDQFGDAHREFFLLQVQNGRFISLGN